MINRDAYIGQEIGNYRLVDKIACGSFGCVYRAEHTRLKNRSVAIKLLNAPLASHEQHESFMQEADVMSMLEHPHILPVLDAGSYNGFPYLITEYCPNGSLRDRLKRQPSRPLPLDEALSILEQIAEALQFAHEQNVIHRDLKPENILFNAKGAILLADFGIAKMLDTVGIRQGTIIGTPAYMAPEQFRGLTSRESDQYALGCIAYELFTGKQPFVAPDMASLMFKHLMEQPVAPKQLNAQLPAHIEQAILKALAKESKARYVDVVSFTRSLQKTAKQWFDEGYDLLWKAKRYEEALEAYEQSIRLDPTNAEAHRNKGISLRRLKRYEEALTAYEQTIRLDPTNVKAYNNKGNSLRELERYEEALIAYKQALRLDPDNANAYNGKGLALYSLDRYEEALEAYEQAIRLDPTDSSAYNNKGLALDELKRYEEALTAYEQAIHLDPTNSSVNINKGNALGELKRYEEALEAYEQAIRLDPTDSSAYGNKGVALGGLKRYEEALIAYEQAIRLDPTDAIAYNNKGVALNNLKRYEEALIAYEQAIRLNPKSAFSHNNKGKILKWLGSTQEAEQAFEKARQLGYEG